jgi:nucleoside diphosphate kinase
MHDANDVGLVVFSPDAVRSGLVTAICDEISKVTHLSLRFTRWVSHTPETVRLFYANSPIDERRFPLVCELLLSSPSLVSFWQGDAPHRALAALKGRSHPALADASSIRGRFWCDNQVCNLVHSSDDASEVNRELAVLGISEDLHHLQHRSARLLPAEAVRVAHNGTHNLACTLTRLIGMSQPAPAHTHSSSAALFRRSFGLLREIADLRRAPASDLSEAFISADAERFTRALDAIPEVTPWERLTMLSSLDAIPVWMDHFSAFK